MINAVAVPNDDEVPFWRVKDDVLSRELVLWASRRASGCRVFDTWTHAMSVMKMSTTGILQKKELDFLLIKFINVTLPVSEGNE
jgi:hypothetical protein